MNDLRARGKVPPHELDKQAENALAAPTSGNNGPSQIVAQPGTQTTVENDQCANKLVPAGTVLKSDAAAAMVPQQITETASAVLEDGTQIEIIEDPEDSSRSLLAVFSKGEVQLADHVESGNRIFVPIPRTSNLFKYVGLPRGVKPLLDVNTLVFEISHLLRRVIDLSSNDRQLLALFILSTWLIERLPVAPYIALVGLPGTGKSTVLSVLNLLCRRALLTADISSAAFYGVCDRLAPTLLIDEAGTIGNTRALFHLLRSGTTRGVTALRQHEAFKTFCPKAFSWTELPRDPALNSRSIVISLRETRRTDLMRVTDPWIQKMAANCQMLLLRFRFEKLRSLTLPKTGGEEKLQPRSRDLYEALALAVAELPGTRKWLLDRLLAQEEINRSPLPETYAAVLQAAFLIVHTTSGGEILVGSVAEMANQILQEARERLQVSDKQAGTILTTLGVTERKRTNKGSVIIVSLNLVELIHELMATHCVPFPPGVPEAEWRNACSLCKRLPTR